MDSAVKLALQKFLQLKYFFNFLTAHIVFNMVLGTTKFIMGEGMPRHSDSTEKGNLFIDFDVVFPENQFLPNDKLLVSFFYFFINKSEL